MKAAYLTQQDFADLAGCQPRRPRPVTHFDSGFGQHER